MPKRNRPKQEAGRAELVQAIDGDYATVEEMAVSYTNNGGNLSVAKNRLTYRGYYYDKELDMYYLKNR